MNDATLHYMPGAGFRGRSKEVLDNPALRKSFRGAMDFLMQKRAAQFPDPARLEALRRQGEAIRKYSLSRLPDLLEQLEANLKQNGVQVHWAENPEQAQGLAADRWGYMRDQQLAVQPDREPSLDALVRDYMRAEPVTAPAVLEP